MTILAVKEAVAAGQGAESYPVEGQKIIYAGKVLPDESKVGDHSIDFTKFVVIMVTGVSPYSLFYFLDKIQVLVILKAKKPAAGPGSSGAPAPAAPAPAPAPDAAAPAAPPADAAPAAVPGAALGLAGPDFENAVTNIMAMGYERPQVTLSHSPSLIPIHWRSGRMKVEAALRAAFGNADRAVEYLLMGMPAAAVPAGPGNPAPPAAGSPAPSEGSGASLLLSFLCNNGCGTVSGSRRGRPAGLPPRQSPV